MDLDKVTKKEERRTIVCGKFRKMWESRNEVRIKPTGR